MMEYLPAKQLGHAEDLSRLLTSFKEAFEETAIASLFFENETKNVLCNTIKELPDIF